MTILMLLRILAIAVVALVALYRPRWLRGQSAEQAFSSDDALAGEHGLDRFAYIMIFVFAYGFLIFLAIEFAPLFQPGDVFFWALIIGALLTIAAVRFWPKKRPPNQWHEM